MATRMVARTTQQLFDLTGKTALVTGGSRGLGLQMAHALGEAGARVMLSSRKAHDLEQAVADLQAAGIDARWSAADCSREEDIRRLADEALQRMGRVDILVNNAGASWGAPAEDYPMAAWEPVRASVEKFPSFNPLSSWWKRLLLGFEEHVSADASGRILVSPALRMHAKLERELMMIGQGGYFELWDNGLWTAKQAQALAQSGPTPPPGMENFSL